MTQVVITPPGRRPWPRKMPARRDGRPFHAHRRIREGPNVRRLHLLGRADRHRSAPVVIFLLINICAASRGQDEKGRQPAGPAPRAGSQSERPSFSRGRTSRSMEMGETALSRRALAFRSRSSGSRAIACTLPRPIGASAAGSASIRSFHSTLRWITSIGQSRNPKDVDALRMRGHLWQDRKDYDPRWPTSNRRSDWCPIEPPRTRIAAGSTTSERRTSTVAWLTSVKRSSSTPRWQTLIGHER